MAGEPTPLYTPLDVSKREIRVLNLYPGEPEDDLILSFDIIQISYHSKSDFDAVSYQWGNSEGQHRINLNNKLFTLTSGQNRMIRNLRNNKNVRRLWIDALCINQNDILERNNQVQLMRLIYSTAHNVCIWLDYKIDKTSSWFLKFLTFSSGCEAEQILKEKDFFWDPICTILRLPYFDRLWIQQEISNAKSITVQCGEDLLPTACIRNFGYAWLRFFLEHTTTTVDIIRQDSLFQVPLPQRLIRVLNRQGNSLDTHSNLNLLGVLHFSRELKVTDERDMVYGIMFLAPDWQEGDLVVDYTITALEVFKQTAISYLNVYKSLAFLEHVNFSYHGSGSSHDKNPSWVPDWRKRCHCNTFFYPRYLCQQKTG